MFQSSEHVIDGVEVKINRAGPRPEYNSQVWRPCHLVAVRSPRVHRGALSIMHHSASLQLGGCASQPLPKQHHAGAQLEAGTGVRTAQPAALGEGPRIYVGGVPEELTEDDLSSHFGKWGAVVDIYFPGKKGQKRVNYCFVTFDSWKAAQRACNESERSICGQVRAPNAPLSSAT